MERCRRRHPLAAAGRTDAWRAGPPGRAPQVGRNLRLRVLLIGKNGQLGHELARSLPAVMEEVVATDRAQLELTDLDAVRRKIR
ncbi:MAG TPA: sugar nucleotide-binding protein, partial [Burkholderiales bacterium]